MPHTQAQRRPMNQLNRLMERFAYTKLGTWMILNIASRLDPFFNRITGGRISVAMSIGLPLALLTTIGAKTGLQRTVALLFFHHDDAVVLLASNGGMERHPGWYFNLRANPQAQLYIEGETATYTAHEAEGDERATLWAMAVQIYAGYAVYQQRAGQRRIPVMVLTRN